MTYPADPSAATTPAPPGRGSTTPGPEEEPEEEQPPPADTESTGPTLPEFAEAEEDQEEDQQEAEADGAPLAVHAAVLGGLLVVAGAVTAFALLGPFWGVVAAAALLAIPVALLLVRRRLRARSASSSRPGGLLQSRNGHRGLGGLGRGGGRGRAHAGGSRLGTALGRSRAGRAAKAAAARLAGTKTGRAAKAALGRAKAARAARASQKAAQKAAGRTNSGPGTRRRGGRGSGSSGTSGGRRSRSRGGSSGGTNGGRRGSWWNRGNGSGRDSGKKPTKKRSTSRNKDHNTHRDKPDRATGTPPGSAPDAAAAPATPAAPAPPDTPATTPEKTSHAHSLPGRTRKNKEKSTSMAWLDNLMDANSQLVSGANNLTDHGDFEDFTRELVEEFEQRSQAIRNMATALSENPRLNVDAGSYFAEVAAAHQKMQEHVGDYVAAVEFMNSEAITRMREGDEWYDAGRYHNR